MISAPVQALVERIHTVDELLDMVLVVSDGHRVAEEVISACYVTIAVTCSEDNAEIVLIHTR